MYGRGKTYWRIAGNRMTVGQKVMVMALRGDCQMMRGVWSKKYCEREVTASWVDVDGLRGKNKHDDSG